MLTHADGSEYNPQTEIDLLKNSHCLLLIHCRNEEYMNLYLSAIGFSDMDSMKESRFIKAAVRQCIDEGYILKMNH